MDKLQIGEVIQRLRKQNKITQEQLANHIGISTAAISKWESGASYPDIVTLPVIARFFDVTIDELMNFKINLTKEDISKIVEKCQSLISQGKLDEAIELSEDSINKYPSSYYLKYKISTIYSLYSILINNEEKSKNARERCVEILEEVVEVCNDVKIQETTLFQLSTIYISLGELNKAEECLKKIHKPDVNPHTILPSVYIEQGNIEEARRVLQNNLCTALADMYTSSSMLAATYYKSNTNITQEYINIETAKKYVELSIKTRELLYPEEERLFYFDSNYMILAEIYLLENNKEKAIEYLTKLVQDIKEAFIKGIMQTNELWCFNYLPNDEQMNGEGPLKMVFENIAVVLEKQFSDLEDDTRFNNIVNELKALARK